MDETQFWESIIKGVYFIDEWVFDSDNQELLVAYVSSNRRSLIVIEISL